MKQIRCTVNGQSRQSDRLDQSLLVFLRDQLGLTGAKLSCGEGACGACTVLLDGVAVRACVTPLTDAADRTVMTIEGLAVDGALHPLQQAFLDADAFQCGYCTPGMIMAALALLQHSPVPTPREIATHMAGNLCRCGMYARIIEAIQQVVAHE
ncbi:MAG TPA: (2Fe-2S)-binding protein [Roseiflexaceae bacterium]|nr:(2Fe-2S)-binding protein [Roseiflexaceae bacterium]